MSERQVELASEAETRSLGIRLGALLEPGDFVGLVGELGAGKTVLARAICEGAGVPLSQVSSPSFAIVASYGGGRLPICHADLYRVGDAEELYAAGYFDLPPSAAMLVEWVDRIRGAAPEDGLRVALEAIGQNVRRARIQATGPRAEVRLAAWLPAQA